MKWLVVFAVCLLASTLEAAPGLLVPVLTPAPGYPAQMLQARHAGKVRALLSVKSDGSVAEVAVLESSHPLLADAVEQTLPGWRFRPWIGTPGAPSRVAVTLPVIFGSHGLAQFNEHIDMGLGNVLCAHLNYEVKSHQQVFSRAPLSKVDLFWYTGQFLFSSYAALQHSLQEREALLRQLDAALPGIVKSCQANPQGRYGDYLPLQIKAMLVGVAEPREAD